MYVMLSVSHIFSHAKFLEHINTLIRMFCEVSIFSTFPHFLDLNLFFEASKDNFTRSKFLFGFVVSQSISSFFLDFLET